MILGRMKSMTGYGRGEHTRNGFKATVEVTSVNRKQIEINVFLPREMDALEPRIRELINQRVSRGRFTVRVSVQCTGAAASGTVRVNTALARAYAREFEQLARELNLSRELSIDTLMRAPGVLQNGEAMSDAEPCWPSVQKALTLALEALVSMREREGRHLSDDLRKRIQFIRKSVDRVRKHAPKVLLHHRDQLRARVRDAGLDLPALEDDRLLKEIVYYADRSDISEELTRLESHFKQFDDCLGKREPVGRTLDFLAQEMNREVNTLGSKAGDSLISREVVTLKAELEKFREQVQNVE